MHRPLFPRDPNFEHIQSMQFEIMCDSVKFPVDDEIIWQFWTNLVWVDCSLRAVSCNPEEKQKQKQTMHIEQNTISSKHLSLHIE